MCDLGSDLDLDREQGRDVYGEAKETRKEPSPDKRIEAIETSWVGLSIPSWTDKRRARMPGPSRRRVSIGKSRSAEAVLMHHRKANEELIFVWREPELAGG
jgi:hypothetical protein